MADTFESKITYDPQRIHAAAVYCSDGRIGEHCDDFMQNGLGLPRYDRVILPGGPAALAGYSAARIAEDGVLDELRFLIKGHELTRVVLIQHQDCAFYKLRLKVREQSIAQLQTADLARAAHTIRQATDLEQIEGYTARFTEHGMAFERVELV